jgi:hypothetical protein
MSGGNFEFGDLKDTVTICQVISIVPIIKMNSYRRIVQVIEVDEYQAHGEEGDDAEQRDTINQLISRRH